MQNTIKMYFDIRKNGLCNKPVKPAEAWALACALNFR